MGIDIHCLRFLEYARKMSGEMGSTLTIGHQGVHIPRRYLQRFLGASAPTSCFSGAYADDLLLECFDATDVSSIDASDYEDATYIRDLNIPLEPSFPEFDSVLDAGSLEHVFDVRVAFANVARCCKVGGQILHVLPANNQVGHGFYQFSPEFFFSLYGEARGFADTEVYLAEQSNLNIWWKVAPPSGINRSTTLSSNETYVLVRTRKTSVVSEATPVQQSDYVARWESSNAVDGRAHMQYRRNMQKRLGEHLPVQVIAVLMQQKRKFLSGMHARNPVLSAIRPPSQHY